MPADPSPRQPSLRKAVRDTTVKESLSSPFALPRAAAAGVAAPAPAPAGRAARRARCRLCTRRAPHSWLTDNGVCSQNFRFKIPTEYSRPERRSSLPPAKRDKHANVNRPTPSSPCRAAVEQEAVALVLDADRALAEERLGGRDVIREPLRITA